MKPAPIPWILCGPGLPPERTGLSAGSTAITLSAGLPRLQHLADAGDRAAGADAGDEDVDLAIGVVPDFLGRGPAMDLRIGGVLELLRDDRVRDLLEEFVGAARCAPRMPRAAFGQHQLGAEQLQHLAPLDRHRLRHHQDQPVAARRRDEGERDAGIARGRLDQRVDARADPAARLERVDHRDADAVLDAVDRVEELELGEEVGAALPSSPRCGRAGRAACRRSCR